MDFKTKINGQRHYGQNPNANVAMSLESDRGRIINSAALRRLQQKTQVFPLERNAAVRSRLTHSLEVQQNGRFIAQSIIRELKKRGLAPSLHTELANALETLVEMACLMHDIGNPAFGHFGEAAINDWFSRYFSQHAVYGTYVRQFSNATQPTLSCIEEKLLYDLCHFEGNAQAIRIVHSLSSLNLTYCQAASILKYTRCGTAPRPDSTHPQSYLQKKVGYYYSEQSYVQTMCDALHMELGHRHPASYIMEAADDIAYCLADIEDAVEKGLISVDKLVAALKEEYTRAHSELPNELQREPELMAKKCEDAIKKAGNNQTNFDNEFFIWLRVSLVHPLVKHATVRFVDNLESIYNGNFNSALLEDRSYQFAITKALKNVAFKYVFCHKEVEQLELQGYKITSGILSEYQRLLDLSADQFSQVVNKHNGLPVESRLLNRISGKFVAVYQKTLASLSDTQKQNPVFEFYYRCRLIQDFVSGMTDQFAYDTYRTLMVAD
ncbi:MULTISPECIES: dGTPase [Pseudoalteromonas]|uniref:dGTPase n=1 Tax=Pseudoalteromonas amylolytica TaxID=1859457 RepID=A0A1S1MJS2_9GAMM|nr:MULTISPECIES: dGTPase [Pseudoalteromonas]OHU84244.1 dGTPase [Pseudoalteromonas sp. JW3]OHU87215.1 dGTPase [Pseudoalteromonas amylolytica]